MSQEWTLPGFWDTWKAIAVGLTGLFGIMGLLTTYKDKDTGRMTVWGFINLVGIILSATMGVASQLVDADNRAKASAAAAKEAAALANAAATAATRAGVAAANANLAANRSKDAATSSALAVLKLVEVSAKTERSVTNSRSAAEAGQKAAAATLGVAQGTAKVVELSQAGLGRIERLLSPFDEPSLVMEVRPGSSGAVCGPAPDSVRASVSISSKAPRVFGATLLGGDLDYFGNGKLEPVPRLPNFGCRYTLIIPLKVDYNRGAISSYLDLPGKTLYATLRDFQVTGHS